MAMESFTYKLSPTFFALLDDMSMWFSQIESETSTDRVWAAQIESDTVMHRAFNYFQGPFPWFFSH